MGLGGSKSNVKGQGALLSNFPSGKADYSVIDLQNACNCSVNLNEPGKYTRGQILNVLRDPANYSVVCNCLMNENEQGNENLQGTLSNLVYSGIPVPSNADNAANMGGNAAANAANVANGRGKPNGNGSNAVNGNKVNANSEGFVDLGNNNHILLLLVVLVVFFMFYKKGGKLF